MGLLTGRERVGYNDSTKYDFAEEKDEDKERLFKERLQGSGFIVAACCSSRLYEEGRGCTDAGADEGSNAGADKGSNADAGTDEGSDTGTDKDADTGADEGSNTGADQGGSG